MTGVIKKRKRRRTLSLDYFVTTLKEVIQMLTMKTVTTFYRNVFVVARSINDPIPDLRPSLPVRVGILTEQDLPAYYPFRPNQRTDEIRKRLDRGDKCFVAWDEGRIVHSSWTATDKVYVPYLRRNLILEPGDFFVYDNYTLPAYRHRSITKARATYVFKYYQASGYLRAIGVVAVENKAGLEMVNALGYHAIGLYSCIRLGPWQWDWQQAWGGKPLPMFHCW